MWTRRKLLSACLSLLLCLLPVTGWAAYQVTADELTQLEQVLSDLKRDNAILMQNSEESSKDLLRAKDLLRQSLSELRKLQEALSASQTELTQARQSLSAANAELQTLKQSFAAYEKENRAKLNRAKLYNVLLGAAVVGIGYYAARK